MNTWGLRSINSTTFNLQYDDKFTFPKAGRDFIVTALRISNLTLNVLGYIPGVSSISGVVRIALGIGFCAITLAVGERNPPDGARGAIIGHWYDEALMTGMAQITRGILEAFVPYGWAVNAGMDVLCSVSNIAPDLRNIGRYDLNYYTTQPYAEPNHAFPFNLLQIV